ncbi:enoyl-CoA hydratase/isomerase family protein [Amycolatopsis lurida]
MTGISMVELADGAAGTQLLDAAAQVGDPVVVVDLDGPVSSRRLESAVRAARACDRVLAGVATSPVPGRLARLTEALDLTLDPQGGRRELVASADPATDVAELCVAAKANPHATFVLAHLLRVTGRLDVPAALDAESFAYSTLLGGAEFAEWLSRRTPRPLPPPARDPILLRLDGARLRITLNRPDRRNAYGRELRDALVSAFQVADLNPAIEEVVLDGNGPAFCAGGDLAEFGTAPDLVTAHLVRTRAGAALPVHRLADRLEVRVHGDCVGAGIELPAFASRVIACPNTTFRLPEVSMGLIPGAGGTVGIPRRIGRWRTLAMALSGMPVTAATALTWGLVDAVQDVRAPSVMP